ncbi:MAG: hypothetical protein HY744_30750 [Deltaproteobacteria bacterium]|nr:hypothetical protein [Deltaproteobacteria bacterium]
MGASLALAGCAPIEEPDAAPGMPERIGQAEQAVKQQPVRMGKYCRTDQIRCAGHCVSLSDDPLNCGDCGHACALDEICVAGACWPDSPAERAARAALVLTPCAVGEAQCPAGCADLHVDGVNCGRCGRKCQPGQACKEGTCVATP